MQARNQKEATEAVWGPGRRKSKRGGLLSQPPGTVLGGLERKATGNTDLAGQSALGLGLAERALQCAMKPGYSKNWEATRPSVQWKHWEALPGSSHALCQQGLSNCIQFPGPVFPTPSSFTYSLVFL